MWWLWILALTPPACIVLIILIAYTQEIINGQLIARIQHRKFVKIFGKDEVLRKLINEVEKEGIFVCFKKGGESKIRIWHAIHSWKSKRVEIPKASIADFSGGKTDSVEMAVLLAHEMGHFQSPSPPISCSFPGKDMSYLCEELQAHIEGFKILEKVGMPDWRSRWVWVWTSRTLLTQCEHCFSVIAGPNPDSCPKLEEVKRLGIELKKNFEEAV